MRNGCVQYGCVQYGCVRPQIGFTHRSIEAYDSIEKFVCDANSLNPAWKVESGARSTVLRNSSAMR